ncbi:1,4-alpha-glucan branching protein GlgB [Streptomyces sp. HNM0575]|nr:1,4-alpha-glucan branching protein GlgB [Streptomyces sp. HNM0575]
MPDPNGNQRPHVPATFLRGRANGPAGDARWGRSLAALTGPLAGPPGGPAVHEPNGQGAAGRQRSRLPQPAAAQQRAAVRAATVRATGRRTAGRRTAGDPALLVPPPEREEQADRGERRAPGGRREPGERVASADPTSSPEAPAPAPPSGSESGTGAGIGSEGGTGSVADRPRAPRAAAVPALPAEDRERLLAGTHDDPHACLGPRLTESGGIAFRTLRPHARSVSVVLPYDDPEGDGDSDRHDSDGHRGEGARVAELLDEGDGFFAGELPPPAAGPGLRDGLIPAYELLVRYGDRRDHQAGGRGNDPGGDAVRVADPYRLPPALGELDLRLFGEGRHEVLWRALGARTMTHLGLTGTRFTVWAPNARGVRVAGDFNGWDGTGCPMRALGTSGVWELFLPGVGDGALYKFEVVRDDGTRELHADPMARAAEVPPANASVVHTSGYRWGDGDWLDRRAAGNPLAAPMSVYEVHLPSWRPGLTYRQLAEQLPQYVRETGFTHVELMPCAEHPFGGSWGYQVTGFYAPTARLGGPDDFKHLVDSLHRAGVGVLMDWVPAHFPKDEWALARFDGSSLYEHPDPSRAEHPDWGTLEFDFGRPGVRDFLVANAVYWCEEFHIDGLRVDAVASMLYLDYSRGPGEWTPNSLGGRENPDAVALLQEMNATLHRRCPGVVTAAEESTTWDGVTRATDQPGECGFGGLGFDFKWNMGWMHDSLGYMRLEPGERAYRGGQLARAMSYAYAENFILPVSHDEVVHGKGSLVAKMPGDASRRLADHRAFLAFMWAHPGKQLLFMGQEFAQDTEWSEERGPDWELLAASSPDGGGRDGGRGVWKLVRDLNARYTGTPALWQLDTDPAGFAWVEDGSSGPAGTDPGEAGVFAFLRYDAAGDALLCVSNFSDAPVSSYRLGVPYTGGAGWRAVLCTDDVRYGGAGKGTGDGGILTPEAHPSHGRPVSVTPELPARSTLWFRPA